MKTFNKTLLAAGIFAIAGVANAIPITGSIGFNGAYTTDTTLDLAHASTIFVTNASVSGPITGSFAAEGISAGATASYSDFTFNPISTPVNNLWSVGSFSFELTQMGTPSYKAQFGTESLSFAGMGIISSTATDFSYDPTPGNWVFTANTAGDSFTWSSSSSVTKSVPEPTAALLLGAGLIGFGVARKARKTRKAA